MTRSEWLLSRTGTAATPPPATRHSLESVLDEATRPTVPEPGPEVVFANRGLSAGRHLREVHDHYRSEMTQVRDVLAQVRAGSASIGDARDQVHQMTMRANDWTLGGYCQAQCLALTQHHTMESTGIFPHLLSRQPDLADVIARLDSEHLAIHELLERIDLALVHLVGHPADHGPITAAVDLLTDTLASHFAYEESQLIAPLARFGFFDGQL